MRAEKLFTGKSLSLLTAAILLHTAEAYARFGGGGGHSSGGSHSSGSHSSWSSHSSGGSYGGGLPLSPGIIVLIIIIVILYFIFKNKFSGAGNAPREQMLPTTPSEEFPEGLTPEKIRTAFMELQDAWQRQDVSKVRKWMSDGMYQRLTAQFSMMKKLTQQNLLSNIHIYSISLVTTATDGNYDAADVAISFSMDDTFRSTDHPELNESFQGDEDTEYWTFIKRTDAKATNADIYNTDNCPNCGASLENKLGEVSRCASCGTLTNNAAYDWILSEVTQADDYGTSDRQQNAGRLRELTQNDALFSVQRVEDIASNVFMQVMEVFTGDSNKKLDRFANKDVAAKILQQKAAAGNFVFDRLYLNEVTLTSFTTANDQLNLIFSVTATFQRVQTGARLTLLDRDMASHRFSMVLSKDLAALNKPQKEIAFSYECANCGAPYDDTTRDTCSYCDAPVVDPAHNWVLTDFSGIS